MNSRTWFVVGVVCLLMAGTGLVLAINGSWFVRDSKPSLVEQKQRELEVAAAQEIPDNREVLAEALNLSENEVGRIGGVDRPLRDVDFDRVTNGNDRSGKPPRVADALVDSLPVLPQPGQAPRLQGDENPQVAGLLAELQDTAASQEETESGNDSETANETSPKQVRQQAVSSWFKPEPFDKAAYQANSEDYLNRIRPARAFHPAQPTEGVTPLVPVSNGFHDILQGEQVVLQVKATPDMPVSFYTPQVGWFSENLLTSITVKANQQGIATATFKAGAGSMGMVDLVAASPVHSRQLQFRVNVRLPQRVQDSEN